MEWARPVIKELSTPDLHGDCVAGSSHTNVCRGGAVANSCGGGSSAGIGPFVKES